jgi:hypothetical protein
MPKRQSTILKVNPDGVYKRFKIVYAPKPKLTKSDLFIIQLVFKNHYETCIYQDISCAACEVYIETLRDMGEISYVPMEES